MSTNIGELNAKIGMGYDPAGLKLFTGDVKSSINMIQGMSSAANAALGKIDPLMAKLSKSHSADLAAQSGAFNSSLGNKHDLMNAGHGGQNFAKLEASLQLQADRDFWAERARQRDFDHKQALRDLNVEAVKQREAANMPSPGNPGSPGSPGAMPAGKKGPNFGMMASQVGFGLQDFSSQVMNSKNGIDGLGRGIMAVSNNVQMLGASFGPTGLAVTAIGGALAGIILPMAIKWVFNTEAEEKAAESLLKVWERIGERTSDIVALRSQDAASIVSSVQGLREQAVIADAQARAEQDRSKAMREQQESAKKLLEDTKFTVANYQTGAISKEQHDAIIEQRRSAKEQLHSDDKELESSNAKINELTMKSQDATAKANALGEAASRAQMMEREKAVRNFMKEDSAQAVVHAAKKLKDQETELKAELATYEKFLGDKNSKDTEYDKTQRDKIKRQLQDNLATQMDVAPKIEAAKRELQMKEAEKVAKEIEKVRTDGLEKFGTHEQRTIEKNIRERNKLEKDAMASPQGKQALEAQQAIHLAEFAKAKMEDNRDLLSKMGPDAKSSAGVDRNSSEGVAAINRALTQGSESSDLKRQIRNQEIQIKLLEQIAREKSSKLFAISGGGAA